MRNKLTEIISPEKVIKPFIKAKKEALDPPSVHDSNIRKTVGKNGPHGSVPR